MPSRSYHNMAYISPEQISIMLPEDLLVLDVRPRNDFDFSRFRDSLHIGIAPLLLRRLKRRGNISLSKVLHSDIDRDLYASRVDTATTVVVIDDDGAEDDQDVAKLLIAKLLNEGLNVHLLKGGYDNLRKKYPEHCDTNHKTHETFGLDRLLIENNAPSLLLDNGRNRPSSQTPPSSKPRVPHESSAPVEVLPYLYLGNACNSADIECLRRVGIHYVLNVTPDVPNWFQEGKDFQYLRVPITDHWSQNLSAYFDESIDFIDEARDKRQGVLVHCVAGISRSVTLTVAYIMHNLQLDMNDAYDYVRRCRSNIAPNFNFMGQLQDFEKALEARRRRVRSCKRCSKSTASDCSCKGITRDLLEPTCYFSSPSSSMSSASASSAASSNCSRFSYEDSDGGSSTIS